jgi:hypothetical protein
MGIVWKADTDQFNLAVTNFHIKSENIYEIKGNIQKLLINNFKMKCKLAVLIRLEESLLLIPDFIFYKV